MTEKAFFNNVLQDKEDILGKFIQILDKHQIDYCVIGGLAVNAYVEPVVSLDLDIVLAVELLDKFLAEAKRSFEIEDFSHSYNLSTKDSDLRIQIQKDGRCQPFISRAKVNSVLGYKLKVACIEDVLQGKIWAYSDTEKRKSKRQKDLADILRLVESNPELIKLLPEKIKNNFLN
ncbi:MAG: hypothetical protein FJ213_09695 [Ignavibacteria bacterium]|nr:hypothetical protein [Ignavibacteria bacterium]